MVIFTSQSINESMLTQRSTLNIFTVLPQNILCVQSAISNTSYHYLFKNNETSHYSFVFPWNLSPIFKVWIVHRFRNHVAFSLLWVRGFRAFILLILKHGRLATWWIVCDQVWKYQAADLLTDELGDGSLCSPLLLLQLLCHVTLQVPALRTKMWIRS